MTALIIPDFKLFLKRLSEFRTCCCPKTSFKLLGLSLSDRGFFLLLAFTKDVSKRLLIITHTKKSTYEPQVSLQHQSDNCKMFQDSVLISSAATRSLSVAPLADWSLSTNSIIAIGAISPYLNPALSTLE